ncbi:Class II aldolase/adducin-like protein [gamma proteobacterium IMCC1989]|nr:Class II aldolase/adducin-like protein [gamma proteobacterium IMCC1989]
MKHLERRQQLIATAIELNTSGINQGTSGNVSVRVDEGLLITPSGMTYPSLTPEDIVLMDLEGQASSPRSPRFPSSEWRFHVDIYQQRNDVQAIVHTHSVYATALACLEKSIPAFHYMVAMAGGKDIRCAPYATYGTQTLSDLALVALKDRKACLLAHHGVIATGSDLSRAFALASEVETLSQQYIAALSVGEPTILSDKEMEIVVDKFSNYGLNVSQY